MKKIFLIFIFFLSFLVLTPGFTNAAGLVPCGNPGEEACTIGHFFVLLNNVYNFIVWNIATPLAVLMILIGGIMILVSAGNPNLANSGKNILKLAIIGLTLVFCSWIIINFILIAIGYKNIGTWNQL